MRAGLQTASATYTGVFFGAKGIRFGKDQQAGRSLYFFPAGIWGAATLGGGRFSGRIAHRKSTSAVI